MRDDVRSRARGCLVGLAVGDALGAAVEFQPSGTFAPVTGMRDGGPHGLEAGEWTDDTAMALALADSIRTVGWDLTDQARRYVDWWETGKYSVNGRCFDIGGTTAAALGRFRASGDAQRSGLVAPDTAGNGSIMRLAPVAIAGSHRFPADVAGLAGLCVESSLPTHRAPQAVSACAVLGVMLAGLVEGVGRHSVTDPGWRIWDAVRSVRELHPEVETVISGTYLRKQPPDIVGSGYVVRSLEAALWAFSREEEFGPAVLAAVNLGDDADTTGAVCGQLAGAHSGMESIDPDWLATLAGFDEIVAVADALADIRL